MKQQPGTTAKDGTMATLNVRRSVVAAANPVYESYGYMCNLH
jgi:DNA replicative helicase MCM subunit Mcm2 (Cdc46/Mcm family)